MKELDEIKGKINTLLSGETQKNALDFIAFLETENIPLDLLVIVIVGDGGDFPHIRPWVIFFNVCDFNVSGLADDALSEFAWAHANICAHFITGGQQCGCGRQPGASQTILGKEFENICHCPMLFINPDAKTLENTKKLLLLLKN